ncbi:hypothetical protein GCM10020258_16110 [Sphingomonas yabuuchiae]
MRNTLCIAMAATAFGAVVLSSLPASAERAVPLPKATVDVPASPRPQVAVLAGGCFWGMEAVFQRVKGVRSVTAGYAGGRREDANYAAVSTERTGHAEAIRITYDPAQVSYATLLRVYFAIAHDPTQVGGQGPDRGPSYRSAIFAQSPEQARVARDYMAQLTHAHAFPGRSRPGSSRAASSRPRPSIRISTTATRCTPISCAGTSPRSRASVRVSRIWRGRGELKNIPPGGEVAGRSPDGGCPAIERGDTLHQLRWSLPCRGGSWVTHSG